MIRFAILGCGRIGKMHARNLSLPPRAGVAVLTCPSAYAVNGHAIRCGHNLLCARCRVRATRGEPVLREVGVRAPRGRRACP